MTDKAARPVPIEGDDPLDTGPLATWLKKHRSQIVNERHAAYYRETTVAVSSGGRAIIRCFIERGRWSGWDIYTPSPTNNIVETLRDAEVRLGLK